MELLTPYALSGGAMGHLIAAGLSEGVWPAPLADPPVLDVDEFQDTNPTQAQLLRHLTAGARTCACSTRNANACWPRGRPR